MGEPQPQLVAKLFDQLEVGGLAQAALDGNVALVPLEAGPPGPGMYALQLHAPGLAGPLTLRAELAGEEMAGMWPLLLRPVNKRHASRLRAFIESTGYRPDADEAIDDQGEPVPEPKTTSEVRESQVPRGDEAKSRSNRPSRARVITRTTLTNDDPDGIEKRVSLIGDDTMISRTLGNGRYEIDALLGVGGMGRVYKARHVALDKSIAVKVLHSMHSQDPEFGARFHQEALAASRLDHPNVMRVLDFGQEDDGLLYIAMELLAGKNLGDIIEAEKRLPEERWLRIMNHVCAGLAAAHGQGIVHRDIKPENVVIIQKENEDGEVVDEVKVCDFGLAKMKDTRLPSLAPPVDSPKGAKRRAKETALGSVKGTPEYMSPEQARGEDIDARTDVYACGVILYELSTGQVPFYGDDPITVLSQHILEDPPPPRESNPEIDPRLDAIIMKAIAKDRDERHQTIRDLRRELREYAKSLDAPASTVQAAEPTIGFDAILSQAPQTTTPQGLPAQAPKAVPQPLAPKPPGTVQIRTPETPRDLQAPVARRRPTPEDLERVEKRAQRGAKLLIDNPERVLTAFDRIQDLLQYGNELRTLSRAVALLREEDELAAVSAVVRRLRMWAGSAEPGENTRETLAAKTLAAVLVPELLETAAEEMLAGSASGREAALDIISSAGTPGAEALCKVRAILGLDERSRPRYVALLRTLGGPALPAIASALEKVELTDSAADPAVVEDLLRAVPEAPDRVLGAQIARFLDHSSAAIRRVAAPLVAAVWGEKGRARLAELIEDPEDGVAVAALVGLRTIGGIDRAIVEKIEAVLVGAARGDEVLAAAAAALGKVHPSAKAPAVSVLMRTIEPRTRSFVGVLRGDRGGESPLVIETAASVLLKIGGRGGRSAVEKRLHQSRGEVKERLKALLGR